MYFNINDPHRILVIGIALFYMIIGSIEDLKTREVMDYSNFSLIAIGIALNLIGAITFSNWMTLFQSLAGLGIFVAMAYIMYYTGQWGGGDSKMLMGLGALIGLQFTLSPLPFIVDFFITMLIVGAIYGMLWSTVLAAKNWSEVSKSLKKRLSFPLIKKIRTYLLFLSAVFLVVMIITPHFVIRFLMLILIMFMFLTFYMWIFIKSIERVVMYKHLPIEKLTEGDWIVNDVIIDGKRICGPKDLGITKEQIEELEKLNRKNKISTVLVKEGIPFVPSFLMAFVISIFVSNVYMIIF